jgi:epsilon-lactone hydrolase
MPSVNSTTLASLLLDRAKTLIVALGIALLPGIALSQAQSPTTFDKDGTLHINGHQLPQSQLVSDEFKKAYAQHLIDAQSWPMLAPSVDAPKAEWDKFDAETDRLIFGPSAKWAGEHYPVNVVETKMAGVPVGIITPKSSIDPRNEHRLLINLHGGGFTMGRRGGKRRVDSSRCSWPHQSRHRRLPHGSLRELSGRERRR